MRRKAMEAYRKLIRIFPGTAPADSAVPRLADLMKRSGG